MNIRYAALLCGFVTIAAVPVMADRMSDYRYSNDSAYGEIHAGLTNAANLPEAKSSPAVVTLLTSSSEGESDSVNLTDFSSFVHSYSTSDSRKAWDKENGDGGGDHDRDHKKSAAPVAVPEPGSLSLLLIGLLGIGGFAYRLGAKQKAISTVRSF